MARLLRWPTPTVCWCWKIPEVINGQPENRPPFQPGSRIITGRADNTLSVNQPYNKTQDVGSRVPYTVGCAPYKGNVRNIYNTAAGAEINVQTDANGIANTLINYPSNQVGRRFKVIAEANGGRAGSVFTHWYLGLANALLRVVAPPVIFGNVQAGQTATETVTLELLDGGIDINGDGTISLNERQPIPAETLSVETVITDPAKAAVALAQQNVVIAQVALEAANQALADFEAANGVSSSICNPTPPATVPLDKVTACATWKTLYAATLTAQTNLSKAKADLAKAEALDALHDPTATVSPEHPITNAQGRVVLTLTVKDLPLDGSVAFIITTIGPEVRAATVTITAKPQQAPAP